MGTSTGREPALNPTRVGANFGALGFVLLAAMPSAILPMDPASLMTPMPHSRALQAKKGTNWSYGATGKLITGRLASSGTSSLSLGPDPAANFCDATISRSFRLHRSSKRKILPLDSGMLQTFTDTPAMPATLREPRVLVARQYCALPGCDDLAAQLELKIEAARSASWRDEHEDPCSSPFDAQSRACTFESPPGDALLANIARHRTERFSAGRLSNIPCSPPRHSKTEWIDSFRYRQSSSVWSDSRSSRELYRGYSYLLSHYANTRIFAYYLCWRESFL